MGEDRGPWGIDICEVGGWFCGLWFRTADAASVLSWAFGMDGRSTMSGKRLSREVNYVDGAVRCRVKGFMFSAGGGGLLGSVHVCQVECAARTHSSISVDFRCEPCPKAWRWEVVIGEAQDRRWGRR